MSEEAVQYLTQIVKPIVEHPDDVHVEHSVDERGALLTLTVHPDDCRFVIGKEGQMARAIRTMLYRYGGMRQSRLSMVITDPRKEGGMGL